MTYAFTASDYNKTGGADLRDLADFGVGTKKIAQIERVDLRAFARAIRSIESNSNLSGADARKQTEKCCSRNPYALIEVQSCGEKWLSEYNPAKLPRPQSTEICLYAALIQRI